ncbi:MAG: large repetitive protein, partial [Thermoplasmata archaeon]|nr:large repetitive protein [Thermoplasmata archaeon]
LGVSDTCTAPWPLTQPSYFIRVLRVDATPAPFAVTAYLDPAPALSGCKVDGVDSFAITPLALGVSKDLTLAPDLNSRCYFSFEPSSGADLAKVNLAGLAPTLLGANVRVYLRQGDVPIFSQAAGPAGSIVADYACVATAGDPRPCTGAIPSLPPPPSVSPTAWYALVYRNAAQAAGNDARITASSPTSCSLGAGMHDIATSASATLGTDAGSYCLFRAPLSQVESLSRWTLTPTGANADIYLRKDANPVFASPAAAPAVTTVADCAAAVAGTAVDVCYAGSAGVSYVHAKVVRPAAGVAVPFTLAIAPFEACSVGGVTTSAVTDLVDNVASNSAIGSINDATCRYHFAPNPLEATVRVSQLFTNPVPPSPGTGFTIQQITESIYVKRGGPASATSFDCASTLGYVILGSGLGGTTTPFFKATSAQCDLQNLGQDVYVTIRRSAGAPTTTLTGRAFSPCSFDDLFTGGGTHPIVAGTPVTGALSNDTGGVCQLKFDVPADSDAASIDLVPDAAADVDMRVRFGVAPTVTAYDCLSSHAGLGVAESCALASGPGTYYVTLTRMAGAGPWSVTGSTLTSCGQGLAATVLAKGVPATGDLVAATGAKCYFTFTPGSPYADPLNPTNDLVRFSLTSAPSNDFDLYVRKNAVPSTATRDCESKLAAGSVDACELSIPDGSSYIAMVRRASGSGPFTVTASTVSGCSLGSGYHALPNGLDVQAQLRPATGAKCFFSLPSSPRDDLLSFAAAATPTGPGSTNLALAIAKDVAPGTGADSCAGATTWSNIVLGGVTLANTGSPYQCDLLLEETAAHAWRASLSRAAGIAGAASDFSIKGSSIIIPTLQAGVPQLGHVGLGESEYWKVILPENATFLDIQTAGDLSALGCQLGSQANSNVALACSLLPAPVGLGCLLVPLLAPQTQTTPAGPITCAEIQKTLEQRCVAETGDVATCAQLEDARLEACAALEEANPGSCDGSEGSVSGACGLVNGATNDTTCDPSSVGAKFTEMDLLVRYGKHLDSLHRPGLPKAPTTTDALGAYDCWSKDAGVPERCLFSADVKEVHDNVTEPVRGDLNEFLANATASVNGNRTAVDAAIAELKAAIIENRTTVIDPLWATIRLQLFNLTGTDPGPLPATPAVPATPATPSSTVPDQVRAVSLPGAGKYFIAVRGTTLTSQQGGDYAIVALHDDVQAPTREELEEQVSSVLANLDLSLRELCDALVDQPAACDTLGAGLEAVCEVIIASGHACTPDISAGDVEGDVCAAIDQTGHDCTVPEHSLDGLCMIVPEACVVVDGVLALVDEALVAVGDLLSELPPVEPPGGEPPALPDDDPLGWIFGQLG